jgi:gas vesicle protein
MKALNLILAGVVIGIFVAPDKGSATWRKLKNNFSDWKDQAKDRVDDAISKGKNLVQDARETVGANAGEQW